MFSILDLQHRSEKAAEPVPAPKAEEPLEISEEPSAGTSEPEEFEFVLGRRQIASLMFVSTIVLMVCVAASYMAGKAMSPKTVAAAPAPVVTPIREPEPPP